MRILRERRASQRDLAVVGLRPEQVPNLSYWWDAATLALNDTDPVSAWPDLSGNGYNLTQATGANQPLFRLINGRQVVRFDGTNDSLVSATAPALNTAFTLLMVGAFHDTPSAANAGILATGTTGQNDWNNTNGMVVQWHNSGGSLRMVGAESTGNGVYVVGWSTSASLRLVTFARAFAGNQGQWALVSGPNGLPSSTTATFNSTGTPTSLVLGGRWLSGAVSAPYAPIDIAEVCRYSRQLSAEELAGLWEWFGYKYGL